MKIALTILFICAAGICNAQFLDKLGDRAANAVERTVERRVERETTKSTDRVLDTIVDSPKKKKKKEKKKRKKKSENIIGGDPVDNTSQENQKNEEGIIEESDNP